MRLLKKWPFLMRIIDKLLLAACVAFGGLGYAAESVKPEPSAPALERDAETGQPGKPAAQAPKSPASELKFATPPVPGKPAAQSPKPPAKELKFDTPPVPGFMLRKPEKPLTVEEMKRQADEAAEKEKARRARAASGAGSTPSGSDADSAANSSKQPAK